MLPTPTSILARIRSVLIANPAEMNDADLITAIAQQLIQPLIGEGKSLTTATLKDLAGKGADAEVTICAGAVDYTATYSVDFVLTQAAMLADIDARILEAINSLTLTDTGVAEITYANKTALFKIDEPAKPILELPVAASSNCSRSSLPMLPTPTSILARIRSVLSLILLR
ncbi:MAG: hypothetical protein ACOX21_05665 [Bacillota bacterium]